MVWRDYIFKASFRDAPFEVESSSNDGGRRNQKHEYPNKNTPYIEDMGKKAETFTIEAFVVGDDYTKKRDKLRNACSATGAGILKHPSYGEISVICDSYSITERYTSEGRIARFSLTFIESGAQEMPAVTVDYKDQINELADKTEQCVTENFAGRFNIDAQPTPVTTAASAVVTQFAKQAEAFASYANSKIYNAIQSGTELVSNVNAKIDTAKSMINVSVDTIDQITSVANQLNNLAHDARSILDTPKILASKVSEYINVLKSALSPVDAIKQIVLATYMDISEKVKKINLNTLKGAAQAELIEQIGAMIERIGIVHQAKALSEVVFTNVQDAQKMLDDFTSQIDKQLLSIIAVDNEVTQSLRDLRAMVVKNITENIKRLPEIRTIHLAENIPSVVLAYDLYEDIERAVEIVERNSVKNPGFVSVGKVIEVLVS